jgi:hypothetical protein
MKIRVKIWPAKDNCLLKDFIIVVYLNSFIVVHNCEIYKNSVRFLRRFVRQHKVQGGS